MQKEREEAAEAEKAKPLAGLRREDLKIEHPLARALFDCIFNPARSKVAEMFQPRRTAFVYEFESEDPALDSDVPTTLRRSKADCPQVRTPSRVSIMSPLLGYPF